MSFPFTGSGSVDFFFLGVDLAAGLLGCVTGSSSSSLSSTTLRGLPRPFLTGSSFFGAGLAGAAPPLGAKKLRMSGIVAYGRLEIEVDGRVLFEEPTVRQIPPSQLGWLGTLGVEQTEIRLRKTQLVIGEFLEGVLSVRGFTLDFEMQ